MEQSACNWCIYA